VFARSHRITLVGAILVALAAGCGSDGPDADAARDEAPEATPNEDEDAGTSDPATTTDDPAASEPNGIVIDVVAVDNNFRPEEIEISAGTEIRWENRGRSGHNVLPVDDTLDWGVEVEDFAPGDEYTLLFDTPGTYPYYCSLHGTTDFGMIGTIVVTG